MNSSNHKSSQTLIEVGPFDLSLFMIPALSRPQTIGMFGPISAPMKTQVDEITADRARRLSRIAGFKSEQAWIRSLIEREVAASMNPTLDLSASRLRTENGIEIIIQRSK